MSQNFIKEEQILTKSYTVYNKIKLSKIPPFKRFQTAAHYSSSNNPLKTKDFNSNNDNEPHISYAKIIPLCSRSHSRATGPVSHTFLPPEPHSYVCVYAFHKLVKKIYSTTPPRATFGSSLPTKAHYLNSSFFRQ